MKQKTINQTFTKQDGVVTKDDLNGYGLMHGGRLLTLCDEIGYLAARKHAEKDCLTRAAHNIQFLSIMREGESFSLQSRVLITGTTTIWVETIVKSGQHTVMSALFVYVAINKDFKTVDVPAIKAESEKERSEQAFVQQLYDQIREDSK